MSGAQRPIQNEADESIPVSYKIPFSSIKNQEGINVAIQPNHRYTVQVNEADAYEVKLSIQVADWDEGGSLDEYDLLKQIIFC